MRYPIPLKLPYRIAPNIVLPVNFYLKSETEQQNIIYYYASYLKIAPDNMQIRVLTQKADISTYLERLGGFLETENNDECRNMIADEMSFVEQLSYNVAVKKRFFIAFDFTPKGFDKAYTFEDAKRYHIPALIIVFRFQKTDRKSVV